MNADHLGVRRPPRGDERGFALLTVVVFSFLVVITGMAFFAMASYETKAAIYGEDTAEAFYLADAGIELARSELLNEGTWRGPVASTALGAGTFFVNTVDSVYAATGDSALYIYSEGHVRRATRAVEVWFEVKPPEEATALLVMRDLDASHGNICISGHVHANGDADFGSGDVHLKCGGTYTDGFRLDPPAIYTEPAYYPNSTYYYVQGKYTPKVGPTPAKTEALVFDRDGNDITASLPNVLTPLVTYDKVNSVFSYNFDGNLAGMAAVDYFFGTGSPFFAADTAAGNTSVVVNFGTYYGGTPATSDLTLKSSSNTASVTATIINSRYTGTPGGDRLDWNNWTGGWTYMKTKLTFEPSNGIALITQNVDQSNAQVQIGTEAHPALLYVTGDVDDVQGQFSVTGSVIVLRDWVNQGGPDITFNPGFIPLLPPYLEGFPFGGKSGVTELLDWREVAVGS
jgi:hypothetical protein